MSLAVASLGVFLICSEVNAFTYTVDAPLVFLYQNNSNYWFGCGPVQCTWSGYKDRDRVFDLISSPKNGGWRDLGSYGRCRVYQGRGELSAGDHNGSWVARQAEKNC